MMTAEEFREAFQVEIGDLMARATRPYSVTSEEMALALYGSAKKYLPSSIACPGEKLSADAFTKSNASQENAQKRQAISELLASLSCDDLCLAVACAKGDDAAWEDFFRDYRGYLISIARAVTQDQGGAEQLADSTFAELYGLRESGGARVSKFSFYSGRGSLRGWLRAVVYQLSADIYRKNGRFVQTEDADDMERIPVAATPGNIGENEFVGQQYETAVCDSLKRAITQLEPRDRLIFAHYYYDEMTLKEIGKLFNVHEATVCRWLAKAQKRTRKLVEKSLSKDHNFNRRQVSEAIQIVAERADIPIGDYLIERVKSDRQVEEDAKRREGQALSLRLD
jgi:RNA polymerase sigma-70 factor (ECF subfamily)